LTANYYILDAQARLATCPIDAIAGFSETDIGFVDLLRPNRSELHNHLDDSVPKELTDEAIHEAQSSSHVAIYQNALLVRMPVAVSEKKSVGLTIVLVNRTIVTIRQDDLPVLDSAIAWLQTTSIQLPNPAMLLFELIDKIVDDDTSAALAIRRRVDDLERELDEHDAGFDLDRVSDCRRDAVSLEAVMEDQRSCLGGLQTTSMDVLRSREFQAYLRDAISHLDHNIRVAGRAEDRLDALQQNSVLKLQDRQNSRLQLLTVVSAVFLPLSLITGIYGMNFRHMPELSWRFGYGLVLLFMLAIAVGLLYVLHRRRWFR
jgi:magnesium transporter